MNGKTTLKKIAALGAIAVGLAPSVLAFNPVASTVFGGHRYDLYANQGVSWADANTDAIAQGGYLAVLTTAAETTAVYNGLVGNNFFLINQQFQFLAQAWIGGQTADGSASTTDPTNWKWVTGEPWTADNIANFGPGQPSGDSSGLTLNRFSDSTFNDENPQDVAFSPRVGGYIIETPIPDGGATIASLGVAIASLTLIRRKLA